VITGRVRLPGGGNMFVPTIRTSMSPASMMQSGVIVSNGFGAVVLMSAIMFFAA
jgi:hypothetical protein